MADLSTVLMMVFYVFAGVYAYKVVGINLTASSVLFSLMYLLHGPAYLYYTRVWGPETEFFWTILSSAPRADVIGTIDIAMVLTFTFVALGISCADWAMKSSPRALRSALNAWSASGVAISSRASRRTVSLAALSIVLVLVPFAVHDNQLGKSYEYFTSSLGEFAKIEMRREAGGSDFYLYNLALSTFLTFLAFELFALVVSRPRKSLLVLAAVFLGLVMLAKASSLSKAPPAIFVLQLLVVRYALRSLQFTGLRMLFLTAMAVVLFAVMVTIAIPELQSLMSVADFLFYRLFMIVNESLLEYFSAIPYVLDHTWGAKLSGLSWLMNARADLPTFWLVGEVHRGVLGSTTTVMFAGDAWAEFAWGGIIAMGFIAGFVTRYVDITLIARRGKSISTVAGLALAHYGIFTALSTSLQTAMITGGLILAVPFVCMMEGAVVRKRPRAASEGGSANEPPSGSLS
ncbi:oligosaccharide repeat unit polymerase [Achromobacter dolens]|uniref:oligosaccharide repeat unit polymerase n=1 Tax=Achromobacter dolens TaxID=1287738 RepID=UPI0011A823EB|nr:oligosaccharide repeat unit polymerase [Achromobacter dolens]